VPASSLTGVHCRVTSLLGVGLLKPAVQAWDLGYGLVYLLLALMGLCTLLAAYNLYLALEPPLPEDVNSLVEREFIVFHKRRHSGFVSPAIAIAIAAVLTATILTVATNPYVAIIVLLPAAASSVCTYFVSDEAMAH
jgi:hypothetical protein